jgi:Domain of unknown function (DUF5666)
MKLRVISTLIFGMALTVAAYAQDQNPAPPDGQSPAGEPGAGMGPGGGSGRGGYGRGGMGMGMMGRGVAGTVTEVAADHYTIKSFTGETYTIHYSANTRIVKQPAGGRGGGGYGGGGNGGGGYGGGRRGEGGGNPPQQIKATDIKVGDSIAAMGDVDASAKSVGATGVMLLDPERAKQMAQMEADYGKTWLMGKVTTINETKVTVTGGPDDAAHTFVADENTTFRRRRDPITLGDVQVGDMVRVEGAVKNGVFTATSVSDMGVPGEARVPRNGPPPQ